MTLTPNGLIMLQKAAEEGKSCAQYDLGVIYAYGDGVPKDEAKAATWYQKAAAQGNKYAQFELGVMYAFGRGLPKDEAMAAEWYQKAKAQGWSRDNVGNESKSTFAVPTPILIAIAIFALFLLVSLFDKSPSVDMYNVHKNSMPAINAEIERREQRGEVSKEEIEEIAARHVLREVRRQKNEAQQESK